ncbi:hypothetical protein KC218_21150, partial [Mycobacterium tuberculosis]|nr:hypothetical protein [Mycobacterium tuberculosis]
VLVVGSPNSSNSNRLRELAERLGAKAHLIDNAGEMQKDWFAGVDTVGVTAGASAPEVLIQEVLDTLQSWGGEKPEELSGILENVTFSPPSIPVIQNRHARVETDVTAIKQALIEQLNMPVL